MLGLLKQIIASEKGQVLPVVLVLLVLGGLTIVPSLNFAATGIRNSQIIETGVNGIYAADSGIEDAIWCLKNSVTPHTELQENINQMQVSINTDDEGTYTLYFGEMVEAGVHSDWLAVEGELVWEEEAQAYKYTITVTWQPESGLSTIHLVEVGARLPINYSYNPGSASGFPDNLSKDTPVELLDDHGAYLLNWEMDSPYPYVSDTDTTATQTFYVNGDGEQEGDYTWVVANRIDIGEAGEISGTAYRITATATRPEDSVITAKIVADVMLDDGEVYVLAWQVLK